jgi:hypothetical protein
MRSWVLLFSVSCGGTSGDDGDEPRDEGACEPVSFYVDADGDGYGSKETVQACATGAGVVAISGDCDDDDAAVSPAVEEDCGNTVDDDCDGTAQLGETWYADADGDGYGQLGAPKAACGKPDGYVADSTDCDDGNVDAHPGAEERCDNAIDDDCDGKAVVGDDLDGDGHVADTCVGGDDCNDADAAIHGGALEVCGNTIDENCDGRDSSCSFSGDYDLADADADIESDIARYDAARLVETADATGDGIEDLLVATLSGDGGWGGGYLLAGPVLGDGTFEDVGFRFSSNSETSGAGRSMAMGDVDDDGIADVGFGAAYTSTSSGEYIVLGPIASDVALSDADVKLTVNDYIFCGHGSDLADVDGDGIDDAVIGAYGDPSAGYDSGTVFVQLGPVTEDVDLHADADVEIAGESENDAAGRHLRAGRDLDGDGIGDFVVSAIFDSEGAPSAGAVFVVYGPGDIDSLADADGKLVGSIPAGVVGSALAMGDFDSDGLSDVATSQATGAGTVYVTRGPASGTVDLAAGDLVIEGETDGQELGAGLAAGDVDDDGVDELLIGAPGDSSVASDAGAAFLVFAPASGTWDIGDVAGASFHDPEGGDGAGQGVAIGDLDADGNGDVVIGAPTKGAGGGVFVEYR